jgi:hypothetical protein
MQCRVVVRIHQRKSENDVECTYLFPSVTCHGVQGHQCRFPIHIHQLERGLHPDEGCLLVKGVCEQPLIGGDYCQTADTTAPVDVPTRPEYRNRHAGWRKSLMTRSPTGWYDMTSSLKAVLRTGSLSGVGCVIGIIGLETTRCTGTRFWGRGQLGVVSP